MILSAAHRPLNPPFRRAPVSNVSRDEVSGGFCRGVFGTFCGQKVQSTPQAKTAVVLVPLRARMRTTPRRGTRREGGAKWPLSQPETPVLNRANKRTRDVRPCSHVRVFASFPGRKDGIAANDSGPMPCPSDPAEETAPAADQIEKASNPPSTTASAPVTNDEASLTR